MCLVNFQCNLIMECNSIGILINCKHIFFIYLLYLSYITIHKMYTMTVHILHNNIFNKNSFSNTIIIFVMRNIR